MPTQTVTTSPARVAIEKTRPDLAVQTGLTAKNGFAVGRGDVVGVITASGLARKRSRAAVTGTAFSTGTATGSVDDASVFVAGDVLKNAAGTTVGTILSIAANVITLTGNAAVNVATAANVFASDGSEVAKAIADEGSDGTGDTPIRTFIGGYLDESLCLRLDATAKSELGGASVAGGIFKF